VRRIEWMGDDAALGMGRGAHLDFAQNFVWLTSPLTAAQRNA